MKTSIMREFILLSINKNYSKTSDELYIAQSALSRHIASLEDELGITLINRSKRTFELTPAGKVVADEFAKILSQYQDMLDRVAHLTNGAIGELSLGVLNYDVDGYVYNIKKTFNERFPSINVHMHYYQPAQMEEDVLSGKIDVGIGYNVSQCERNDIKSYPFLKLPIYVIVSKNHRFAEMNEVHISDLEGQTLLEPDKLKVSTTHALTARMLEENGVAICERVKINNFDEVPILLNEKDAVYITSMVNPSQWKNAVQVHLLKPEKYSNYVGAFWRADNMNPSINVLCNVLKICYP